MSGRTRRRNRSGSADRISLPPFTPKAATVPEPLAEPLPVPATPAAAPRVPLEFNATNFPYAWASRGLSGRALDNFSAAAMRNLQDPRNVGDLVRHCSMKASHAERVWGV